MNDVLVEDVILFEDVKVSVNAELNKINDRDLSCFENCDHDTKFQALYSRVMSSVDYVSERFCVPSILDAEDIKQELLLWLDSMIDNPRYQNLNHVIGGFKSMIWFCASDMIRRCKRDSRDFRQTVNDTILSDDGDEVCLWDTIPSRGIEGLERPDEKIEWMDTIQSIKNDLSNHPNAKRLFELFVDPTEMGDSIISYQNTATKQYSRIPLHIYQTYLNMHNIQFREALTLVKCVVCKWIPNAPRPWNWTWRNPEDEIHLGIYLQDHGINDKVY